MMNEVLKSEEALGLEEDFSALLDEVYGKEKSLVGTVISGVVIDVVNDDVLVDVGLKSEGRIPLKEFSSASGESEPLKGDTIEVFFERYENAQGEVVLSREKARREDSWNVLEVAFSKDERVNGVIISRVKGGFTVDLSGAIAFLPGSQVDLRPVRDVMPLMGKSQPFRILKMDRKRGNIVVSRRAVLEESRAESRNEILKNLKENQVYEGIVKNITDYGAFIDLGGLDGLLHVTDIAWKRINHPSEALTIGETVRVCVIRYNAETRRVSVGMKQLEVDPWENVEAKYPINSRIIGNVTSITDYGAFVELEPGVEGLVHVSEMSWTKKNIHPGKIVSTSQQVEVIILEKDKRRISLSLKRAQDNPWSSFAEKYTIGTEIEGQIKNITEFGLFVGLDGEIDGMVHLSDLDWSRPGDVVIKEYKKRDVIKAKVLEVDVNKERVALGIKQLQEDPFKNMSTNVKKGDTVTCIVSEIRDNGINVTFSDDCEGYIRRGDLSRDRDAQKSELFNVGDKLDALVTQVDVKKP